MTRAPFVNLNKWNDMNAIPCHKCGASYRKPPNVRTLHGVARLVGQDTVTKKYIYTCYSCGTNVNQYVSGLTLSDEELLAELTPSQMGEG